jgi:hypothetical protein
MKALLLGAALASTVAAPAMAEMRYDRNLEKAAMQIVASKIGDIRGGFAYGQMPQIVAIQDVEPQPHMVIGVSPSMVVGREMALTPAVQARVSRIIF